MLIGSTEPISRSATDFSPPPKKRAWFHPIFEKYTLQQHDPIALTASISRSVSSPKFFTPRISPTSSTTTKFIKSSYLPDSHNPRVASSQPDYITRRETPDRPPPDRERTPFLLLLHVLQRPTRSQHWPSLPNNTERR